MSKMIKKMLLAGLLLTAAVAPVRVDAISAHALSVLKRVFYIGSGTGFASLAACSTRVFIGNYSDEKKHGRGPLGLGFAGNLFFGALLSIPSAVSSAFLFSKGLKGVKVNIKGF